MPQKKEIKGESKWIYLKRIIVKKKQDSTIGCATSATIAITLTKTALWFKKNSKAE